MSLFNEVRQSESGTKEKPIVRSEDSFRVSSNIAAGVGTSIIPTTPYVEIQFRINSIEEEGFSPSSVTPSEKNEWITVSMRTPNSSYTPPTDQKSESSLKFDNYFENLTLEDNGGVVKCNLSLFDKDLERLENILIKSIIATKAGNDIAKKKLSEVPETDFFEFLPNPSSNINFRLRFGYSDPDRDERVLRPSSSSLPEWKERTKEEKKDSIYLKSPWLYFMMMGLDFTLNSKGVVAKIQGMSMSNTFLDKTKIIKRFTTLQGTPQKLMVQLAEYIYKATNGLVQVIKGELPGTESDKKGEPIIPDGSPKFGEGIDYGKPSDLPLQWSLLESQIKEITIPDSITDSDKRREIEEDNKIVNVKVSLGGEPRYEKDENGRSTGKLINDFMGLRQLLSDFASKCPPILRNKINGEYITDSEKVKTILNNLDDSLDPTDYEHIPFVYSVNEVLLSSEDDTEVVTVVLIRFYYRRLDGTNQEFIKSYDYMNSPKSLITSFNIKSKLDFIQLNQTLVVKGSTLNVLLSSANQEGVEGTASAPIDISKFFDNQIESDNFTLVNKVIEETGTVGPDTLAAQVVDNMNQGIFYGDIEILGDPFYLFDTAMQPYQYFIKLNVFRSRNEYANNNDKILAKSYLSGCYLVKKIVHTINKSGFKTTLSLQRFPSTKDDNSNCKN